MLCKYIPICLWQQIEDFHYPSPVFSHILVSLIVFPVCCRFEVSINHGLPSNHQRNTISLKGIIFKRSPPWHIFWHAIWKRIHVYVYLNIYIYIHIYCDIYIYIHIYICMYWHVFLAYLLWHSIWHVFRSSRPQHPEWLGMSGVAPL